MLSKKHYEAIAAIISSNWVEHEGYKGLIYELVEYFKQDNPSFQEARFFKACGVSNQAIQKNVE